MERASRYTVTLDDDPMISPIIAKITGIPSLPFTSAEALQRRAASFDPVAAFIDVHLETDISGIDIIPQLRALWKYTPILMITGDSRSDLIGDALAAGANDFIRKPLEASELMGRLKARVAEMNHVRYSDEIVIGDLRFSKIHGSLQSDGKRIYLPKLEAKLFLVLLENREMVVSKESLKRRIWGELNIAGNTLDKRISKLRSFLSEVNAPVRIEADYGKGVCLRFDHAGLNKVAG